MNTFRITTLFTAAAMFLSGLQPYPVRLFSDSPPAVLPVTETEETAEPETTEAIAEPENAEEPAVTTSPVTTTQAEPTVTTVTVFPEVEEPVFCTPEMLYTPAYSLSGEVATAVVPETFSTITTTTTKKTETSETGAFLINHPRNVLVGDTATCYIGFTPGGLGGITGIEQFGTGKLDISEPYDAGDNTAWKFDFTGVEPGNVRLIVSSPRGNNYLDITVKANGTTTAQTTKSTPPATSTTTTTAEGDFIVSCINGVNVGEYHSCWLVHYPEKITKISKIEQTGNGRVEIAKEPHEVGSDAWMFDFIGSVPGVVTLQIYTNCGTAFCTLEVWGETTTLYTYPSTTYTTSTFAPYSTYMTCPTEVYVGETYDCALRYIPGVGEDANFKIEQTGVGRVEISKPSYNTEANLWTFKITGKKEGNVTLIFNHKSSQEPYTFTFGITVLNPAASTTAATTTKVSTTIVTTGTARIVDDCPSEIRVSERVTCMVRSVPYGTVEIKTITQKGTGSVEIHNIVNENGRASFEVAGERAGKVTLTLAINHLNFSYNYTIELTVVDAWVDITSTTSATTASTSKTTSTTTESTPILTGTAHIMVDSPTNVKVGETVTCEVRSVPYGSVRVEGIEQEGTGKISVVSIDNSQGYAVIKIRGEQAGKVRLLFKTDRYDIDTNLTVSKKNGERNLGDLNGDTTRDVKDAVLLARLAGGDATLIIGDEYKANADIDNDGTFSALDLSLLLQAIVGKITLTGT